MSHNEIIRAWKDEDYRSSLTSTQHSQLPGNPAGEIEMTDKQMELVGGGGGGTFAGGSCLCCHVDLLTKVLTFYIG